MNKKDAYSPFFRLVKRSGVCYKLNFGKTDSEIKEVMMRSKVTNTLVLVFLAIVFILVSSGCEKLRVGHLTANYHMNKANSYFADEKWRLAIGEYEAAVASNPKLGEAYQFLGEAYKNLYRPGVDSLENMDRAQKALDALNKALEFRPNDKQILYSLADMYDRLRDFEEAEKLYLRILDSDPGNMGNYYVVAQFYSRYSTGSEEEQTDEEGRTIKSPFKRAEEMYMRRIELDPDNPEGYAYAAQFYDNVKPAPLFDKAIEFHQLRLIFEPDNAQIWYSIGVNRFSKAFRLQNILSWDERKKLGDESEQALKRALEIDADYPEPYVYLNILYRNVFVGLYPEREDLYTQEADRWQEKWDVLNKKRLERRRLEEELRGGRR